jgi:uncharacterized protein YjbJ (UPF0337 family)
MSNIKNIIEGQWEEIEGFCREKFGKIKKDEWEQIAGSYTKLAGKIKKSYGLSMQEVEGKLALLLLENGFESVREEAESFKNTIVEKGRLIKENIESSFEDFRERSSDFSEKSITYIKENPIKAILLSALSGLLLAKII